MTEPAVNEDRAPILRRHMWIAVLIAALVVIRAASGSCTSTAPAATMIRIFIMG